MKAISILLYRDVLPIQTDNLKDVTSKSFKNMKTFVDEKCAGYKKFLEGKLRIISSLVACISDNFQHVSPNIYNLGPSPKTRYTARQIEARLTATF